MVHNIPRWSGGGVGGVTSIAERQKGEGGGAVQAALRCGGLGVGPA